jgi:hypothetical protein
MNQADTMRWRRIRNNAQFFAMGKTTNLEDFLGSRAGESLMKRTARLKRTIAELQF